MAGRRAHRNPFDTRRAQGVRWKPPRAVSALTPQVWEYRGWEIREVPLPPPHYHDEAKVELYHDGEKLEGALYGKDLPSAIELARITIDLHEWYDAVSDDEAHALSEVMHAGEHAGGDFFSGVLDPHTAYPPWVRPAFGRRLEEVLRHFEKEARDYYYSLPVSQRKALVDTIFKQFELRGSTVVVDPLVKGLVQKQKKAMKNPTKNEWNTLRHAVDDLVSAELYGPQEGEPDQPDLWDDAYPGRFGGSRVAHHEMNFIRGLEDTTWAVFRFVTLNDRLGEGERFSEWPEEQQKALLSKVKRALRPLRPKEPFVTRISNMVQQDEKASWYPGYTEVVVAAPLPIQPDRAMYAEQRSHEEIAKHLGKLLGDADPSPRIQSYTLAGGLVSKKRERNPRKRSRKRSRAAFRRLMD